MHELGPAQRTVAITGGAGSLGRQLALLYARRGFVISICDVGATAPYLAAESIRAAVQGSRVFASSVDVTDAAAVSAWLAAAHKEAPLAIVFVNAGVSGAGSDAFQALRLAVQVNVLGAAHTAAAAAELWMSEGLSQASPRGRIVFISSLMTCLPRLPRLAGEEVRVAFPHPSAIHSPGAHTTGEI